LIYYSIPWDSSMNIGQYYNRFMEALPADSDVACFLDGDACFTTTYYGRQLEAILGRYPESGLFAGMTNRVGCRWQTVAEADKKSNDIEYHRELGARIAARSWDSCVPVQYSPTELMSGVLFMLRKATWKQAGGFPEKGMLGVDNEIHRRVAELGLPVMLMSGVYVYHWYRGGKPDANKHLKMARQAVYTVITRGYDTLKEPTVVTPGWDYVCFTDDPTLTSRVWEIRRFPTEADPVRAARRRKILPQEFMPEYDLTVWVDGHLGIACDLSELVKRFHKDTLLTVMSHPDRECVYDEADACKEQKKDDPAVIDRQIASIRAAGYPAKNGMVATGMLIRDNRNPDLRKMAFEWWNMVAEGSRRDQLSFNYVAWKASIRFGMAPWSEIIGTWLTKSKHKAVRGPVASATVAPAPVVKPVSAAAFGPAITYEAAQKQARLKRRGTSCVDRMVWANSNFNYGSSLSHVSRESVRWLAQAGVPISAWAWDGAGKLPVQLPVFSKAHLKTSAVIVMDRIPMPMSVWDKMKFQAPFIAAYYMCEGTRVKDADIIRLERYDAVFVPTQFCYRALIESGLKTPVFVWGHGFDHKVFPYVEPEPNRPFTYLWYGDENRRKGYDLFLKAFCELKVPNVRAWVRSPGSGFLSKLSDFYRHRKDIVFDTRVTPPEQLKELMKEADVVVGPHRGEGFGLCVMEAMACGRPAIMTRWSGPLDYGGGDDITYWVDTDGYEPAQFDVGVQARPDFKKLVQLMSKAALEPEEVRRRGILASKHIHENWRWEQKVMDVLPVLRQLIPGCKL
jgi:glycosyltransferase involved in cell wall biosynthesis